MTEKWLLGQLLSDAIRNVILETLASAYRKSKMIINDHRYNTL